MVPERVVLLGRPGQLKWAYKVAALRHCNFYKQTACSPYGISFISYLYDSN